MSNETNQGAAFEISEDKQDNSIVRFLFEDHGVRGEIVHIHESVRTLMDNMVDYPLCIKALMLELTSAAVLIAATLKANGTVAVQIQCGKGPKALNFAFINIDKNLKFYGNVSYEQKDTLKDATFSEMVGEGGILVISAFPENGTRYQGIVSLDKPTLAESLEAYFKESEQLDTSMRLYSDPASGMTAGLMLQIIPDVENNHQSLEHLSTLSSTMTADEIFHLSLHESLRRLFWNDKIRVFDPQRVVFKCTCSTDRILQAIYGLPQDDLAELADDPKGFEVSCNSCGKVFHVTPDEVRALLERSIAEAAKAKTEQDK